MHTATTKTALVVIEQRRYEHAAISGGDLIYGVARVTGIYDNTPENRIGLAAQAQKDGFERMTKTVYRRRDPDGGYTFRRINEARDYRA